ncbi:MAG: hypothetical protein ABWX92_00420 [Mycetocola sp.]
MHPPANDSAGWLLGSVAEFDGLIDATDHVIGLLAVAGRTGDTGAVAEIADLHRRVRELDGSDTVSVRNFADELARRAAELTE